MELPLVTMALVIPYPESDVGDPVTLAQGRELPLVSTVAPFVTTTLYPVRLVMELPLVTTALVIPYPARLVGRAVSPAKAVLVAKTERVLLSV